MVVVRVGSRKFTFCRLLHFSSTNAIGEIEKLVRAAVAEEKSNDNKIHKCASCVTECDDLIKVGSPVVPDDKFLILCTTACMLKYLERKRCGDGEAWVKGMMK